MGRNIPIMLWSRIISKITLKTFKNKKGNIKIFLEIHIHQEGQKSIGENPSESETKSMIKPGETHFFHI